MESNRGSMGWSCSFDRFRNRIVTDPADQRLGGATPAFEYDHKDGASVGSDFRCDLPRGADVAERLGAWLTHPKTIANLT